jgi:hypothetical protein
MTAKSRNKAAAAFKKSKRSLKPWEQVEQNNIRKTERLKALRLARDAENAAREAAGESAVEPVGEA